MAPASGPAHAGRVPLYLALVLSGWDLRRVRWRRLTRSRSKKYRRDLVSRYTNSHVVENLSATELGMGFGFAQQIRLRTTHPRSLRASSSRSGANSKLLAGAP